MIILFIYKMMLIIKKKVFVRIRKYSLDQRVVYFSNYFKLLKFSQKKLF
jgi:hypothetical protein